MPRMIKRRKPVDDRHSTGKDREYNQPAAQGNANVGNGRFHYPHD